MPSSDGGPVAPIPEQDPATFLEFIRRVRAGDEAAAGELVSRYEPSLRLEIRLRLLDPQLRRLLDVHHAHCRGILHRDLKPANILLDDAARPYVTDFGLAKRSQAGTGLTRKGDVLGSPGFMAPEQASGDSSAVTIATDVYGLGAILYALLTSRAPFAERRFHQTIARLQSEPPEPPSRISRAVPRPLELICLKCLEKEPSRRYASAEAVAQDLKRYLAGEPLEAKPVSTPALRRGDRRHPAGQFRARCRPAREGPRVVPAGPRSARIAGPGQASRPASLGRPRLVPGQRRCPRIENRS